MSESTSGINCPECAMSFDTMDELGRHSRQRHATITESKGDSKENAARHPSIQERVQTRTEEKGKEKQHRIKSLRSCLFLRLVIAERDQNFSSKMERKPWEI
jgi:hypothetical protein